MKVFGGFLAFISGSLFGQGVICAVAYPVVVPISEIVTCSLRFGAAFIFGYIAAIECISYSRK